MNPIFDHEKLQVYQESLHFITWLEPLLEKLPKSLSVRDQLDRASTSIPLNIAEGNGKFTKPDRCRYFDNARGSSLECAKAKSDVTEILAGKERVRAMVSMLIGLIRANSDYRLHEGEQE
jgi:four helix bundle protein